MKKKVLIALISFTILIGCFDSNYKEKSDLKNIKSSNSKTIVEKGIFKNELFEIDKNKENEIDNEYKEMEYTIDNPFIKINPYGRAPLTALVKFETEDEIKIEVELLAKDGEDNYKIKNDSNFKKDHSLEIIGLYPNHENEIKLGINYQNGKKNFKNLKINIPGLNASEAPLIVINKNEIKKTEYFLPSNLYPLVFDSNGNIRSIIYLQAGGANTRFSKKKTIFATYHTDDGSMVFYEINLMGKILKMFSLKNYLPHHDMFEKENGNILLLVSKKGSTRINKKEEYVQDFYGRLIEIDIENGNVIKEIDFGNLLDVNRETLIKSESDWLHDNSIIYDEKEGSYIISARHQGVMKINNEEKLEWILADHRDWGKAGRDGRGENLEKYLLKAGKRNLLGTWKILDEDAQNGKNREIFKWPYGQHSVRKVSENEYIMFDNNNENIPHTKDSYSRYVKYRIDEDKKLIEQIEEYKLPYSSINSNVQYDNGNIYIFATDLYDKNTPRWSPWSKDGLTGEAMTGRRFSKIIKIDKNKNKILDIDIIRGEHDINKIDF